MGKNLQNPWKPQKMNRFSEKAKHLDSYQSIVDIFKFFYEKKTTYQMENEILRANIYFLIYFLIIFYKLMILYFNSCQIMKSSYILNHKFYESTTFFYKIVIFKFLHK